MTAKTKPKTKKTDYRYSFGRKAFFTTLGITALLGGMMVAAKMNVKDSIFYAYAGSVVGLIVNFCHQNARISIAHRKNNNGG